MKHYRGYAEREADRLVVGEKVWLVDGIYTSEAEIVAVPVDPFTTYRVSLGRGSVTTEHRSDLYRRPMELQELVDRVEADHDALTDTLKEFQRQWADELDRCTGL